MVCRPLGHLPLYNMDQVVGQALATFKQIQQTVPLRAQAVRNRGQDASGQEVPALAS
jgi:hypothetical protein